MVRRGQQKWEGVGLNVCQGEDRFTCKHVYKLDRKETTSEENVAAKLA